MDSQANPSGRVVIISASVGAGHDGAAAEISARLAARGCSVDRHDFIDLVPPPIGPIGRRIYQTMIESVPSSWDFVLSRLGASGDGASRLGSSTGRMASLANRRILRAITPDTIAVVSTYPLASQAIGQLRAAGRLSVPAITFLTDMSVHPLWVHSGIDLHLALHDIAAGQARGLGARDVRVVMPAVRPAFTPATDPVELRERFGLPAGPRLALVVAGSWGVGEIEQAVTDIAATGLVTPVVACGRNATLHDRIARSGVGIPFGWISDMPALINACDIVVQNAGGLTSLEAMSTGVPVITYRCLAGHGRTNADALDRAGWVPWVREQSDLVAALTRALSGSARTNPFTGTDVADAVLEASGTRSAALVTA
jgi:UDP-N-acetylglucosamine:LPS N-acetylglucosamine transferase